MADNEKMKQRLREHLDTVLADAPSGARTEELRQELYQNMCDRYDDQIAEGNSPAAAYNAAVVGLGDISPLLEELTDRPVGGTTMVGDEADAQRNARTEERRAVWKRYRTRSAILTPCAIVLYILCLVPVILLDDCNENLGVVLMFSIAAIATGLLIFNYMSRPTGSRPKAENEPAEAEREDSAKASSPRAKLCQAITGAMWVVAVMLYLAVSFLTMRWELTWMIFPIAIAVDGIIKALFDLGE